MLLLYCKLFHDIQFLQYIMKLTGKSINIIIVLMRVDIK